MAAAASLALVAAFVPSGVVTAPPASADVLITVTSTSDGGPGSLRSAVDLANAATQPVTIELAATDPYDLTICGTGPDDTNATGDLDLTATQPVTIYGIGGTATIRQTCADRRLLDHHGPGSLTLTGVTLSGGNATTFASGDGGLGVALRSASSLAASNVVVTASSISQQSASRPGKGPAVYLSGTASSSLDNVEVRDNQTAGILDEGTSGTLVVTDSSIVRNVGTTGFGLVAGSRADAASGVAVEHRPSTFTRVVVAENRAHGVSIPPPWPPGSPADPPLDSIGAGIEGVDITADHVIVQDNVAFGAGAISSEHLVLSDSLIEGNWGMFGGVRGTVDIRRTTIRSNHGLAGGGVTGAGSITGSTIEGNDATAMGSSTVFGYGGGVHVNSGETMSMAATTITGNSAERAGGGIFVEGSSGPGATLAMDGVTIVDDTVSAPMGSPAVGQEIAASETGPAPTVTSRASVVGAPGAAAGQPVCRVAGGAAVASSGFNVVGDSSCLVSPLASDAVSVDPLLGPLGDHGGPTATRVPAALSPARDRVPVGDAACAGTDQRGVARRQGPGCDAGAVEAHLGRFVAQAPTRVIDTRDGTGGQSGPISGTVTVDLPALPAGTTAAVLDVTADRPTAESFLSISPPGTDVTTAVSNLNFPAGRTIANLVTVPIVDAAHPKVVIHNNTGGVQVIGDLAGTYVEDEIARTGGGFTPIFPLRILDTRPGTTTGGPTAPLGPGETRTLQVIRSDGLPLGTTAVAVTLTVTQTTAQSHLTAGPTGVSLPVTSNLNWPAGDTIANLAIVKVGTDGAIQIRNNAGSAEVIADVAGFFAPGGGYGFRPVEPTRILDTRPGSTIGGPAGPIGLRTVDVPQVPSATTAVVVNLTGVSPTATTHLTAWLSGEPAPNASNLNLPAGAVRPVLATVATSTPTAIYLRNNSGWMDVLADLQGYYG